MYNKTSAAGQNCFSDVRASDWFAPLCVPERTWALYGYPLWGKSYFRPNQSVTFAEALKIAALSFDLSAGPTAGRPWYEVYYQSFEDPDFKAMLLSPGLRVTRAQPHI